MLEKHKLWCLVLDHKAFRYHKRYARVKYIHKHILHCISSDFIFIITKLGFGSFKGFGLLWVTHSRQFISDCFVFNNGSANPHSVWGAFKCAFQGHVIKYSAWKYKQTCSREEYYWMMCKWIKIVWVQIDLIISINVDQTGFLKGCLRR